MTVELAQTGDGQGPFVWPEDPEDTSPYVPSPSHVHPFAFPPLALSAFHLPHPSFSSSLFLPTSCTSNPHKSPPSSPLICSNAPTNTPRAQHSWQKEQFDKAQEIQEAERKKRKEGATLAPEDGEDMAKQAKALLAGKEEWRPG